MSLNLHVTHMCFSTACLPISKAGGHASLKNSLDQRSGSEPAVGDNRWNYRCIEKKCINHVMPANAREADLLIDFSFQTCKPFH